jgi:hypothetical protein
MWANTWMDRRTGHDTEHTLARRQVDGVHRLVGGKHVVRCREEQIELLRHSAWRATSGESRTREVTKRNKRNEIETRRKKCSNMVKKQRRRRTLQADRNTFELSRAFAHFSMYSQKEKCASCRKCNASATYRQRRHQSRQREEPGAERWHETWRGGFGLQLNSKASPERLKSARLRRRALRL